VLPSKKFSVVDGGHVHCEPCRCGELGSAKPTLQVALTQTFLSTPSHLSPAPPAFTANELSYTHQLHSFKQ
jgi:hypothetical protein